MQGAGRKHVKDDTYKSTYKIVVSPIQEWTARGLAPTKPTLIRIGYQRLTFTASSVKTSSSYHKFNKAVPKKQSSKCN